MKHTGWHTLWRQSGPAHPTTPKLNRHPPSWPISFPVGEATIVCLDFWAAHPALQTANLVGPTMSCCCAVDPTKWTHRARAGPGKKKLAADHLVSMGSFVQVLKRPLARPPCRLEEIVIRPTLRNHSLL
jgi:hypothetical protein